MVIDRLESILCRDFLVDADVSMGRTIATTAFEYPNGDSVNLYFEDFGDSIGVTDEGATVGFLRHQGIELTPERRHTIKMMCQPFGVDYLSPSLRKQCTLDNLSSACLVFCEAITSIASIYYHSPSPVRSPLPIAVGNVLRKTVEPKRSVERNWITRRHDPKGAFPVEFHVNGVGQPRNIFTVTSRSKTILVAAVVHFLRSHAIRTPTLTIVDPDAGLKRRDINRLQLASSEIKFGLAGHEKELVKFALGGMEKD